MMRQWTLAVTRRGKWVTQIMVGTLLAFGFVACGDGGHSSKAAVLKSISVSPAQITLAAGTAQQVSVTGVFSDGSSKDVTGEVQWTMTQANVASVSSAGMVKGLSTGSVRVEAILQSMTSSTMVSVSPATLSSISLGPQAYALPKGKKIKLSATGTYSDGSRQDITNQVTWSTAQTSAISIDSSGVVTGVGLGSAQVNGTLASISAQTTLTVVAPAVVSLSITPASPALSLGSSQNITATGLYSDGTTQDVTTLVSWSSLSPEIATVSPGGVVSARALGIARVSAAISSITAVSNVTVSPAALISIGLSVASPTLPLGVSAQAQATGTYTDGSSKDVSSSAAWSTSAPGVAAVSNSGMVTAKAVGNVVLGVSLGTVSGSAKLAVVSAALTTVAVSPPGAAIPLGASQQLSAVGTYTDGSTADVTQLVSWSTSAPGTVEVSAAGVALAKAAGNAVATASSGTLSGTSVLTVTSPALVSIAVTPAQSSIAIGASQQFVATGVLSDGSTQAISDPVSWSADQPSIAEVDGNGMVTAEQIGSTSIFASADGLSGSALISVQPIFIVDYFDNAKRSGFSDTTIRMSNPGLTGGNLCAMVYVFDQSQEMNECCGCVLSPDGLRTLSLRKDLVANPLTGVKPQAGVIKVVPADYASNPTCNAGTITPSGMTLAWATHTQKMPPDSFAITEEPFQQSPLGDDDAATLQSACAFIQSNGSGKGTCTCGNEK